MPPPSPKFAMQGRQPGSSDDSAYLQSQPHMNAHTHRCNQKATVLGHMANDESRVTHSNLAATRATAPEGAADAEEREGGRRETRDDVIPSSFMRSCSG